MNHYQQHLIIKVDPSKVYAALTTSEGLCGWWTQDCKVASKVGDTIHVRFGTTHKDFRIETLEPNRVVGWICTHAHINHDQLKRKDEWINTQIIFRLSQNEEGFTDLNFEHIGLNPSLECYDLCNNGWQYFLKSLQAFAQTGEGTPYESGDKCEEKTAPRSV